MAAPAISVVMPVHNALPYLDEAIESILNQTFKDFEFVILNDASTDGSTQRLRQWAGKDSRIRLFEVTDKLGPARSSDRVARAATAPIVARMDADDISLPDRLLGQFDALNADADVGVVGCLSEVIDSRGTVMHGPDLWKLGRRSRAVPFAHGATMYRREIFDEVGGYDQQCDYWEDQDIVARMSAVSAVAVIPRVLYRKRESATNIRSASSLRRQEDALDRMYETIKRPGGRRPGPLTNLVGTDDKVDPRVFVSLGSVVLWSGSRPRLFRRLLRRGKLRPNLHTAGALVWTAWASASPGSLRSFLRVLLAGRNALAAREVDLSRPVRWSMPGKPVAALTTRR